MIIAIALAFCLVAITFVFHYRVLLLLGTYVPDVVERTQSRVLFIVIVLFFAHIVEIGFYAVVYALAISSMELGTFDGASVTSPMSYLYYSGVIYTSLGLGDIYPAGHVRFITAVETLNGLMLITWSASFTFIAMGRLWQFDHCRDQQ
jgi:hypothetical protein